LKKKHKDTEKETAKKEKKDCDEGEEKNKKSKKKHKDTEKETAKKEKRKDDDKGEEKEKKSKRKHKHKEKEKGEKEKKRDEDNEREEAKKEQKDEDNREEKAKKENEQDEDQAEQKVKKEEKKLKETEEESIKAEKSSANKEKDENIKKTKDSSSPTDSKISQSPSSSERSLTLEEQKNRLKQTLSFSLKGKRLKHLRPSQSSDRLQRRRKNFSTNVWAFSPTPPCLRPPAERHPLLRLETPPSPRLPLMRENGAPLPHFLLHRLRRERERDALPPPLRGTSTGRALQTPHSHPAAAAVRLTTAQDRLLPVFPEKYRHRDRDRSSQGGVKWEFRKESLEDLWPSPCVKQIEERGEKEKAHPQKRSVPSRRQKRKTAPLLLSPLLLIPLLSYMGGLREMPPRDRSRLPENLHLHIPIRLLAVQHHQPQEGHRRFHSSSNSRRCL